MTLALFGVGNLLSQRAFIAHQSITRLNGDRSGCCRKPIAKSEIKLDVVQEIADYEFKNSLWQKVVWDLPKFGWRV